MTTMAAKTSARTYSFVDSVIISIVMDLRDGTPEQFELAAILWRFVSPVGAGAELKKPAGREGELVGTWTFD